ncbi:MULTISPECIES: 5-oxoprolinase subunit PxpB [Emticicia]|uniref:5-oxoprolinase subunit PxpB n=1 Tax=Emticicia TaxID=312278 RepID=UPI000A7AD06C|nr:MULTISPECIES: 5-oxoprolinase subunit PxpB [Emticicia]
MVNYKIFPLSDSAITIDFGNIIDEKINDIVMQLYQSCTQNAFVGLKEVMPAYASLTIFYDVFSVKKNNILYKSAYAFVEDFLIKSYENIGEAERYLKRIIEIPVFYDGEDLAYVADYHQISEAQVVELHTNPTYRVYMMGFLPGFAYMGGLDARIATPRRATPRTKVPAGSVGIAGNQTGIYPSESPGGWQLIGRTELQLYTPNATEITLLKTGDLVKFIAL